MLVALIFLSIVQDVFWFVLNRDTEDDEDDGGLERGVKSFSRAMSFVSFVWRVSPVNTCLNDLLFVLANLCVCALVAVCAGYDPVERLLRLRCNC